MSDNSEVQVVVLDPDDYEGFAAESVAFEEATFRGESPMKVRAGGDADEAVVQGTHRRAGACRGVPSDACFGLSASTYGHPCE